MKTVAQAFQEISEANAELQTGIATFVALLLYVGGVLMVGYAVFWKPLLSRWIF